MFQARATLLGSLLLLACASEPTPPAEYAPLEAPPAAIPSSEAPPPVAAPEPPPPAPPVPPVQVVAGESTPIEGPTPAVVLRAPHAGQLVKGDTVEVTFTVKGWPLAPDPGNHVHLIVDNEPYIAIRDTQKPIELRALMQKELGHDLSEGTHVLRAFPSRGHHESVKEAGAFDVVTFHFKKKSADPAFDAKAPMLTYSRPKGCVDLGQRVLLDFYVANTKLAAAGHRVRFGIDGTLSGEITSWQPHYIENLTEGDHELRLTLVNEKGEPVPGTFNDTTRTIKIRKDCKANTLPPAAAAPVAPPAAAPPAPADATKP